MLDGLPGVFGLKFRRNVFQVVNEYEGVGFADLIL